MFCNPGWGDFASIRDQHTVARTKTVAQEAKEQELGKLPDIYDIGCAPPVAIAMVVRCSDKVLTTERACSLSIEELNTVLYQTEAQAQARAQAQAQTQAEVARGESVIK
jgi:hypothetical protein